jgi:hypothetical protein
MQDLAQCIIDVLAWLLPGFVVVLVVNWLVSLFDRG